VQQNILKDQVSFHTHDPIVTYTEQEGGKKGQEKKGGERRGKRKGKTGELKVLTELKYNFRVTEAPLGRREKGKRGKKEKKNKKEENGTRRG